MLLSGQAQIGELRAHISRANWAVNNCCPWAQTIQRTKSLRELRTYSAEVTSETQRNCGKRQECCNLLTSVRFFFLCFPVKIFFFFIIVILFSNFTNFSFQFQRTFPILCSLDFETSIPKFPLSILLDFLFRRLKF